MSFGTIKITPPEWYLNGTHDDYLNLLQRVRLLPEFNNKHVFRNADKRIKNLSRMYYLVPAEKVHWRDNIDIEKKDVRYSLWSALRRWMNIDEYEALKNVGYVNDTLTGNIGRALYHQKLRGLGSAVENFVFALNNVRNPEYADYDELREEVKIVLKYSSYSEIEELNLNDPDYSRELISNGRYIEKGIERLAQDFVEFWTSLPDEGTPYIVQRYAVAQMERYIRGRRNKYGKPIGGLLYDFGERYLKYRRTGEIDRINRIEINTEEPEIIDNRHIPDAFVNSIVDRLDVDLIFNNLKIRQREMPNRQKIILYEMIYSDYYRANPREGWISGIREKLAEHNIRGGQATILNEIRKIEAIVGDIAIEVLTTDNLRLPDNVYRGVSKYLCTHETFESRVRELNPYVEVE